MISARRGANGGLPGHTLPTALFTMLLLALVSCGGPGNPGSETPALTSPSGSAQPISPTREPTSTVPFPVTSTTPSPVNSTTPPVGGAKPLVVHIVNFAYVPAAPVVLVGQPILIINDDNAAHTWSAAPGAGWTYTSGNLEKGQRATYPGFATPGHYTFLCYYHAEMPAMNGIVTVKASR